MARYLKNKIRTVHMGWCRAWVGRVPAHPCGPWVTPSQAATSSAFCGVSAMDGDARDVEPGDRAAYSVAVLHVQVEVVPPCVTWAEVVRPAVGHSVICVGYQRATCRCVLVGDGRVVDDQARAVDVDAHQFGAVDIVGASG